MILSNLREDTFKTEGEKLKLSKLKDFIAEFWELNPQTKIKIMGENGDCHIYIGGRDDPPNTPSLWFQFYTNSFCLHCHDWFDPRAKTYKWPELA